MANGLDFRSNRVARRACALLVFAHAKLGRYGVLKKQRDLFERKETLSLSEFYTHDIITFGRQNKSARTEEAITYLTTCCRNIGAFSGTGAPYAFLKNLASQIQQSKPSKVFPNRYKEHVAYAVDMVASNQFLSPPAAIASLYLATRFEFYFRILSGKLNGDGTWISSTAKSAAQAAINDRRLKKERISSLSLAYQIMILMFIIK